MTNTQSYLIEIVNLVPDDSIFYVQAPSCDHINYIKLVTNSKFPYYNQVTLTLSNKKSLIDLIVNDNIVDYFQSIEIRLNEVLLFEGYDGMEYGTISQNLRLTETFIHNFIKKDMCIVSTDW